MLQAAGFAAVVTFPQCAACTIYSGAELAAVMAHHPSARALVLTPEQRVQFDAGVAARAQAVLDRGEPVVLETLCVVGRRAA